MNCYMPREVPPQLGGPREGEEAKESEHEEPEGDIDELHPYHARGDGAGDMLSEIRGTSNTGEFQQLQHMMRRIRTTRTRRT
jgi:hypothetical protein